ncbi:MAG: phosphatase PAP2 family protein [Firmicutes bacterium]|nr:phosphatase PAP2 family protein [Bacillota bacterium]
MDVHGLSSWFALSRSELHALLIEPSFQHAQVAILIWIQQFHHAFMDTLALALSHLGNYSSYLLLSAVLLWLSGPLLYSEIALAATFAMVAADIGKLLLSTARPIGTPGIRSQYVESATGASFPSGHALVAMAVWPRFARYVQPLRLLFWLLPFAIGLSRLYLGVHWPVDVAAGWLIGWWISRMQFGSPQVHTVWLWRGLYWISMLVCLLTLALVPDTRFAVRFGLTLFVCLPFLKGLSPVSSVKQAALRLLIAGPGFALLATAGAMSMALQPVLPYMLAIYTALAAYVFTRFTAWSVKSCTHARRKVI